AATRSPVVDSSDLRTGRRIFFHAHEGEVCALAISPNGRVGLTAGVDGVVRSWDVELWTGAPAPPTGHTDAVRTLAVAPDGSLVASGGADHGIYLWNPSTGAIVHRLAGHQGAVRALAFARKRLLSGSEDGTVRI